MSGSPRSSSAFTDTARVALAGFLAGYRSLTSEAYAPDLRQFTIWYRIRTLALFAVRRADIEGFARYLGAQVRAGSGFQGLCCGVTAVGDSEVEHR